MALTAGVTSSFSVGSAGGNREDLEDVIWDLFADETYCLTNFDKVNATATFHEWEKDTLAGATLNAQLEGDEATFATIVAPTRVGNYCQILRKTFLISGTQEAVKKAGRASEAKRQAMKKMRELKNDIEYALVTNQGSSGGAIGTARQMGGMESWLFTNNYKATTTADAATTKAFASNVVTSPIDGTTTGALTEATFKTMLGSCWSQGGDARVVLVNTTQKAAISAFTGIATKYNEVKGTRQAAIIGAADMYVSDVGNHTIILHRHIRQSVVLAVDPDYWAIAFLRRPFVEPLAKTGDGEKRQMLAECTLVSRNEASSGKVVACT